MSLRQAEILYRPTDDMVADAFTKALRTEKFEGFRAHMGVAPTS